MLINMRSKSYPSERKRIVVPISERECQELMCGEEFDWTFDDIDVTVKLETGEDGDE